MSGIDVVTELANSIVNEGVIPADWDVSFIVNSYTGKVGALLRGIYRCFKLLEHVNSYTGKVGALQRGIYSCFKLLEHVNSYTGKVDALQWVSIGASSC